MVVKQFQNFWAFDPSSPGHTCVALTRRKRKCQRPVRQHKKLDLDALQIEIPKGIDGKNVFESLSSHATLNLCAQHKLYVTNIDNPVFQWAREIDQGAAEDSNFHPAFHPLTPRHHFSIYDAAQQAYQFGSVTNGKRKPLEKWTHSADPKIEDFLFSSLLPRDAKPEVLYAYNKSSDPNLVKIGTTSRSLRPRFNEIRYTCGYDPNLLIEVAMIPYARRVEQLIFLELQHFRRQEKDCPCCIEHAEWFEIDVEVAKEIIKNWTEWIIQERPYDEDGHIRQNIKDVVQGLMGDHETLTGTLLMQSIQDPGTSTEVP